MRRHLLGAPAVLAMMVHVQAAAADPGRGPRASRDEGTSYLELAPGIMVPVSDSEYTAGTNNSFKLGARLGLALAAHVAFEFTGDWTRLNEAPRQFFDVKATRYRILAGTRIEGRLGRRAHLFGRVAVGSDIIHANVRTQGSVVGTRFELDETDLGVAVEFGTGVVVEVTPRFAVGAQFALPIGLHYNADDPEDSGDLDLEYKAVDLDFLAAMQLRF